MKKLVFTIAFASIITIAFAQESSPDLSEKKQQNIEALKVAFISKELDLTPEEAQKFWPVYNQYSKEMITTFKAGNEDVLDRDEKVLNIRKRYKEQFSKVLGGDRVNKMFSAEGRFRQILIKAMRNQKQQRQQNINRPKQRNGFNQ
jgi:Spy/CpxP family protein refolding chaperone